MADPVARSPSCPLLPRSRRRLLLVASLALLAAACSGSGPGAAEPLQGRVVDLETGAPIAGAEVIEWYFGGGASDGARPVHRVRYATTDADGVFLLGPSHTGLRGLLAKSYGPKFAFVHPDYGLQRQARQHGSDWVLEGDTRRTEQARADLMPYCRGEIDDEGARRIREVACTERPQRSRDTAPNP